MSSKSRSLKASGKRSFTIHNAAHVDGCPTKFSHKDYTGRYNAHTPDRAARKVLSNLCRLKRIRGQCTLYIELRETTQGSDHKVYAYKAKRIRLAKPQEIKRDDKTVLVYYRPVVKAVARIPSEKCPTSRKSSGRMISYKSKLLHSKKQRSSNHTKKSHTKKSMTKRISSAVRKTMKRIGL